MLGESNPKLERLEDNMKDIKHKFKELKQYNAMLNFRRGKTGLRVKKLFFVLDGYSSYIGKENLERVVQSTFFDIDTILSREFPDREEPTEVLLEELPLGGAHTILDRNLSNSIELCRTAFGTGLEPVGLCENKTLRGTGTGWQYNKYTAIVFLDSCLTLNEEELIEKDSLELWERSRTYLTRLGHEVCPVCNWRKETSFWKEGGT